ncbi:PfkB family carbohydrate kinase [Desulforhopalus singaporensis]|uniref:Fructokinase n=1 Tax=Desulforhopalus singaporensis TaxID=91360 RepID=A0A1H0TD22_9BACT|nr:PfkB family carbohydrate kinase [Desulforhopalus singaporensis]SDP51416.1 fructokinase [Desulforhopalus singaporensis]
MKEQIVAGIGEILWDVFGADEQLGGAPVNFCYHANSLGCRAVAISTVADDRRGQSALDVLAKQGMSTEHITVVRQGVTGYVVAEIDDDGVASYRFPDNVAWDHLTLKPATMALAETVDAVCFGSLCQRSVHSRNVILSFLGGVRPETLKVFDVNLRQHFYSREILQNSLCLANVVKLNSDELLILGDMENIRGTDTYKLTRLVARYDLQLAVLTRGAHGSLLVSPSELSAHPGVAADTADTIGAGDAFTAATVIGLLQGNSLEEINEHANKVAAAVCSGKGAMVALPPDLKVKGG